MAIECVNFKPCNSGGSEQHNRRTEDYVHALLMAGLDIYYRQDLTEQNQSVVYAAADGKTLQQLHQEAVQRYTEKVGQPPQKDRKRKNPKTGRMETRNGFVPLKEAVVLITPETSMEDLQKLAQVYKDAFQINPLQIHMHRDEGHWDEVDGEIVWKPNLHAHIVFDWTDHKTGKTLKLGKAEMRRMQDVAAEVLGMERGQSKEVTKADHVPARAYGQMVEKAKDEVQKEAKAIIESAEEMQLKATETLQEAETRRERAIAYVKHAEAELGEKRRLAREWDRFTDERQQEAERLQTEIFTTYERGRNDDLMSEFIGARAEMDSIGITDEDDQRKLFHGETLSITKEWCDPQTGEETPEMEVKVGLNLSNWQVLMDGKRIKQWFAEQWRTIKEKFQEMVTNAPKEISRIKARLGVPEGATVGLMKNNNRGWDIPIYSSGISPAPRVSVDAATGNKLMRLGMNNPALRELKQWQIMEEYLIKSGIVNQIKNARFVNNNRRGWGR